MKEYAVMLIEERSSKVSHPGETFEQEGPVMSGRIEK